MFVYYLGKHQKLCRRRLYVACCFCACICFKAFYGFGISNVSFLRFLSVSWLIHTGRLMERNCFYCRGFQRLFVKNNFLHGNSFWQEHAKKRTTTHAHQTLSPREKISSQICDERRKKKNKCIYSHTSRPKVTKTPLTHTHTHTRKMKRCHLLTFNS